MENKKFWKLSNAVEGSGGSRLYIDGPISQESWWGDEATPQQLRQELKEIKGNTLEVVINSPGGDVWAGVAMYDALKELDLEVTVRVSGLAASAASFIAMAGDKIVMTPGSTMMIHKASMFAWGNSDDMQKAIDMLETVEEGIVSIYVERTGQTREAVEEMMKAETWMSAENAVELGFADSIVKPESTAEDEPAASLFNGNLAFSMKATQEAMKSYFDKVAKPSNEAPGQEGDDNDSQEPQPTAQAVTAEPKKASVAEVTEPQPEAKANKPVNEENMDPKTKEIAKNQVIEPDKQATPEHQPANNYLASMKSVEDFAEVLRANAGKSSQEVKAAWKDTLVKNGLTDPDYFKLPDPVITSIDDAVKTSGIYSLLNKTGLDVHSFVWDDTDPEADTSRAGGHRKGDTKDEQALDFDKRTIRPRFIYKYLVLNKEDVREQKSTGALVKFVLNELPTRIIREIERAVVIGDGRASNNKRHITSFISIKSDVVANNTFATSYTPEVGESRSEAVANARDLLLAEGTVVMVAKKGYSTKARFEKDSDGKLLFPLGTKATDVFDIDTIIEPTWFTDATDPDYDAYLVVFGEYDTVGDNTVEAFTNFKLETNENEFLQELYAGGGLMARKAAVGIEANQGS